VVGNNKLPIPYVIVQYRRSLYQRCGSVIRTQIRGIRNKTASRFRIRKFRIIRMRGPDPYQVLFTKEFEKKGSTFNHF
jgi:hypothetical protein